MKELLKAWLWIKVVNEILALLLIGLSISMAIRFLFVYLPEWISEVMM